MADCEQLDSALDQLEAALIAGDLQGLATLAAEIETALTTDGDGDRSLALRITDKARRNEVLIKAALQGISSARRRVAELSHPGRFSTYDSGGNRNQPGLQLPVARRRL